MHYDKEIPRLRDAVRTARHCPRRRERASEREREREREEEGEGTNVEITS